MGTTSLTIGNEILSTTMHITMKEFRDGLHLATAFLDAQERVHGKAQPSQEGGSRIIQPVTLAVHSNTTALDSGYERIDLSAADVSRPAVYDFAHVVKPVVISMEEELINAGKARVIAMAEMRTKSVANEMRREFVKQLVAGGVPQWQNKWSTLNGVDYSTGFLEENAVGGQTNNIGGLSKSTYSATTGWQNQSFDGAGSFNANGLAGLYDLKVETNAVSASGPIDIILASKNGFKNLKRTLQAQERYMDDSKLDGGRMAQYWDGVRIEVEPQMPAGPLAGSVTATNPISFYFLNSKDIYVMWDPSGYFFLEDFETVSGEYDVRAAKMRCRGQLVAAALGSSGIAVDLEVF
jgi:hypothetical protein